jgi:hypothetical protein
MTETYEDTSIIYEAEEIDGTDAATEVTAAYEPVEAQAKPRNRWSFDHTTGTATVVYPSGNGDFFDFGALPEAATRHILAVGFKIVVGGADDMHEAYGRLLAGQITTRKPAAPGPKLNDWRLAIANAMVDATKKLPEPLSLDDAKNRAAALSKDQVRAAKTDTAIVKAYNKLTGAAPVSVASLLA